MKKTMAAWMAVVLMIVSASSLAAHHSLSQFDTTTAVRVKGTIVLVERVNPHTILFVDRKGCGWADSTLGGGRTRGHSTRQNGAR